MTKHLDSLKIQNFRMLEDFEVEKLGQVNLIVGKNNSGKSTVLEALRIYAGNARVYTLEDIAKSHDEKYQFLDRELGNLDAEIPFLGFFSAKTMLPYLSFTIGNDDKELKVIYVDTRKTNEEIRAKYQHIVNTNGIFFGQKNLSRLFFATNNKGGYYAINLNQSEDSPINAHYSDDLIDIPCGYVPVNLLEMKKLAYLWDEILVAQQEDIVHDILKSVHDGFKSLIFIENPHNPNGSRVPYMSILGQEKRTPLKTQGYGTQRLLQIALNIYQAKDGFLLIDEFENGLHYSVQEKVWGLIFEMAKRLNIQVFATTHSWDCIEAFSKVANQKEDIEGVLIKMGRSIRDNNKGQVIASVFDEDELAQLTQADVELR